MKRQNRIAFFNILSTVVLKGSAFFTGMLFARLLGGSGYGELKLYTIAVNVIAILFTLQTQTTLPNARVEYPEGEQERYQSSVMTLSALTFGSTPPAPRAEIYASVSENQVIYYQDN